jgi:hypothetical protein
MLLGGELVLLAVPRRNVMYALQGRATLALEKQPRRHGIDDETRRAESFAWSTALDPTVRSICDFRKGSFRRIAVF